jgi:GT2 family glycosyltransferase
MPPLRIAVGIATCGRAAVLAETLAHVRQQTQRPHRIVICHTSDEDVAGVEQYDGVELVRGRKGLPAQRNRIIEAVGDCDLLIFFDDDFLASPQYVAVACAVFTADPTIVASTGMPIMDGVKGPGIDVMEARALIAADVQQRDPHAASDVMTAPHGYGCNLAIRLTTARQHNILFDERLPLYGWSEDVDYTHRLKRYGQIVKLARARGVHLGTKLGRSPGRRLGYSQVANPVYLWGTGSYSWGRALRSVGRNFVANFLRSFRPEPWIDRRGRLRGNALAFVDWTRGRMAPERILEL